MTSFLRGLPFRSELLANACRFTGAPGHVESYFLRANDPTRKRALWLKATILAPVAGEPLAETWFVWFDAEKDGTASHKDTHPWKAASFQSRANATAIGIGDWRLTLGDTGSASGRVRAPAREASFDLAWTRPSFAAASPLSIYPWRLLREGPFPKSKLLTPYPWLRFSGTLTVDDERITLDGWEGMQGHNWGKAHPFEYAWGHCTFPASDGQPEAVVEGFSGRLRVAGRTSPWMSALVVRRGTREYRFDRLFDPWRQEAEISRDRWSVRLRSAEASARLCMDTQRRPVVCLDYQNPDGSVAYCYNSKLADVLLEVHPRGAPPFVHRSAHGGALEFLRRERREEHERD